MTAIFGFSNHHGADVDRLKAMARSMSHRGAAAPEYFCSESAAIGFCATQRRHGKSDPDGYGFDDIEANRGELEGLMDFMLVDLHARLAPLGHVDVLELVAERLRGEGSSGFDDDELFTAAFDLQCG